MRLLIDARMLDHSGIGVYLANILPVVLRQCASLRPLVLTPSRLVAKATALAGGGAQVKPWDVPPLSTMDMAMPHKLSATDLWWAPHFNVPLLSRVPLVVTLHDLLPMTADAGLGTARRLAVTLWLAAIRRRARRVICVSQFTRDEAVRIGRIVAGRTSVLHLGVDPAWAARPGTSGSAGPPYLIFVGLVKRHKNVHGLLRAFEMVMPHLPHRLVVVGRHTGTRAVDTAALELARRLGPRVELLEDVPQSRLIELVAGADLLVQPSMHEGFGLPALEAMAAGTPVLAACAGALPEVCSDAAVYCDPHSPEAIARAIRSIIDDPGLRRQMRERGLQRARDFDWQTCAQGTSRVLIEAWHDR